MNSSKLNTMATVVAFECCKEEFQPLNREVHEAVLYGEYLSKYSDTIKEAVEQLASRHPELLMQDFIGKLRFKLPTIDLAISQEFYKEEAKWIVSALVTSILIDSEEVTCRKDINRMDTGKFRTEYWLQLHGELDPKYLLDGLYEDAGVVDQRVVDGTKLSGKDMAFLADMSSMAFKLSDVASSELILKGYSLMQDYNSSSYSEHRLTKEERYKSYIPVIIDTIGSLGKFYLSMKYDSRGRMYYIFQLAGLRPQGKLWETLLIDAAEPKIISDKGADHIKHIIYTVRYGRSSLVKAVTSFTDDDLIWAESVNLLDDSLVFVDKSRKELDEFGERLLVHKCALALRMYEQGIPCNYIFGKDLTNSGLMMAGAGFNSSKMQVSSNIGGTLIAHDSHMDFAKAYGIEHLPRINIKEVHTALLHGSTNKTLVKELAKVGTDITLSEAYEDNIKAYGEEVTNIDLIASWGTMSVGNLDNKLKWVTSDGFKASHKAVVPSCTLEFRIASAQTSSGYRTISVQSDMPALFDPKGFPVYDGTKTRGLFANITHSYDAALARVIARAIYASGNVCLLKHDDYILTPELFDVVIKCITDYLVELQVSNPYGKALEDIAKYSKYDLEVPELVLGTGTGHISDSVNMLMP